MAVAKSWPSSSPWRTRCDAWRGVGRGRSPVGRTWHGSPVGAERHSGHTPGGMAAVRARCRWTACCRWTSRRHRRHAPPAARNGSGSPVDRPGVIPSGHGTPVRVRPRAGSYVVVGRVLLLCGFVIDGQGGTVSGVQWLTRGTPGVGHATSSFVVLRGNVLRKDPACNRNRRNNRNTPVQSCSGCFRCSTYNWNTIPGRHSPDLGCSGCSGCGARIRGHCARRVRVGDEPFPRLAKLGAPIAAGRPVPDSISLRRDAEVFQPLSQAMRGQAVPAEFVPRPILTTGQAGYEIRARYLVHRLGRLVPTAPSVLSVPSNTARICTSSDVLRS